MTTNNSQDYLIEDPVNTQEQKAMRVLKTPKAVYEGDLIAGATDTSGISQLITESTAIDASLTQNARYDLNQMISSMAMTQQGFISNLRDYLRARTNELLNITNKEIIQGPGHVDTYLSDGNSLFTTDRLHEAITYGSPTVVDKFGYTHQTDDVVDRLSSIIQTAYTQDAFLEALQNADSLGTDVTNDFINGVRLRMGELTSSAANYAAYAKAVLSTPANVMEKIMALFASGTPDIAPEQIQNLNTPDANYTGVNASLAWCSDAVSKLSGIDVASFTEFAKALNRIRRTWPLIIARCYLKLAKKAFPVVKNAIVTTFVDPLDIQLANNGLGFDKSIETSVVDIAEQFTIYPDDYPALHAKISNHFGWIESAELPGDVVPINPAYLVVPTFGATYYIKPIKASMSSLGIRISIQAARHLYHDATGMISDLLTIQPSPGQTYGEMVYSWLGSYATSAAMPYPFKSTDNQESKIYNDFIQSNRLMLLGLALTSGSEDLIETTLRYYSASEGLPDKYNWLSFSGTKAASEVVTNVDWINAVTSFSPSVTSSQLSSFRDSVLSCIEQGFSQAAAAGVYVPYTWAFNQLPGSYTIKCDADNISAFGAKVKTVAVIAVAVAATIAAFKITKQLRVNAFEKKQQAIQALKFGTAEEAYNASQKARWAARIAGVSFPDVLYDSIGLFTTLDAAKLSETLSDLSLIKNGAGQLETDTSSIIDLIEKLSILIK